MSKQEAAKAATVGVSGMQQQGLELSDVLLEHPAMLKGHPENTRLFRQEDEEYFSRLRDDIRERGIIVPLIVKSDKTLLAGHNRHRVALELKLEKVPVQYVDTKLTEEKEIEFLIKDNLYRRQLTGEDWLHLYRKLFPNFDERIKEKVVGRKKAEEIPQGGGISDEEKPLTAREIAKVTGQKERTVQHQLKKHREAKQEQEPEEINQREEMLALINAAFSKFYAKVEKWDVGTLSKDDLNIIEQRINHQAYGFCKSLETLKKAKV